jgi:hypothetical protein
MEKTSNGGPNDNFFETEKRLSQIQSVLTPPIEF